MQKVKIDKLDHEGRGITKIDGKIVFVKTALPNEVVNIEIINDKKKYCEAKIIDILNKSDVRISPICPAFNNCGGCSLLHMDY